MFEMGYFTKQELWRFCKAFCKDCESEEGIEEVFKVALYGEVQGEIPLERVFNMTSVEICEDNESEFSMVDDTGVVMHFRHIDL